MNRFSSTKLNEIEKTSQTLEEERLGDGKRMTFELTYPE
jgi:hypothetical protein